MMIYMIKLFNIGDFKARPTNQLFLSVRRHKKHIGHQV